MNIEQLSIWRKTPEANGDSVLWGGNKVVIAATDNFVIIRNEHVSQHFLETNKEEVISRADFERDYVTQAEAARRINLAADKLLADLKQKYAARPKLGTPAPVESKGYDYVYEASNGVRIHFDYMGHYRVESSGNPVSTFDAAWIAAKSAEIQKAYQARTRSYSNYSPY